MADDEQSDRTEDDRQYESTEQDSGERSEHRSEEPVTEPEDDDAQQRTSESTDADEQSDSTESGKAFADEVRERVSGELDERIKEWADRDGNAEEWADGDAVERIVDWAMKVADRHSERDDADTAATGAAAPDTVNDGHDADHHHNDRQAPTEAQPETAGLESGSPSSEEVLAQLRARMGDEDDPRGPPRDRDDHDRDEQEHEHGSDRWSDDDAEQVEKALEGRIEKDRSAAELEESRKQAAAGELTADELAQRETAHQELADQADADKAEVSERNAELIDEVVDGHRDISVRQAAFDAEEEQVASGAVTAEQHERNAAQLDADKQKLYKSTDELREATNRDRPDVPGHAPDGDGAAAGCGKSGVFVECGSVSESDGDKDRDRCVAIAGVSSGCGASSESGDAKGSASCVLTGADQGCGSTTSKGDVTASAWCSTGEGDCEQSSGAGKRGAEMTCETDAGTCRGSTEGPAEQKPGPLTERKDGTDADVRAVAVVDRQTSAGKAAASATCTATARGCGITAEVDLDPAQPMAEAAVSCRSGATGCTGAADTSANTDAAVEKMNTATTKAAASCSVTAGGCGVESGARAADIRSGKAGTADAAGTVECGKTIGCTGTANTTTGGAATTTATAAAAAEPAAARDTAASATCTATSGGCSAESGTSVTNRAAGANPVNRKSGAVAIKPVVIKPVVSSAAGATVECAVAACKGTAATATSGAASGDIVGIRDSAASADCAANGVGGRCGAQSGSKVTDRAAAKVVQAGGVVPVSGPVSVSDAAATIACTGGRAECGGSAASATTARDTAVTPEARGTSATAGCVVTGGGCKGGTTSAASSAPDHVVIDPATGKPAEGQPLTGPSSTSSSNATLDCPKGCTGAVTTTATGTDAAVGGPRTSTGTA
ncbi:hypothetical protein, partial [Pseudonocardia sp. TRM90224]|uniref:hypothetical protein n=1 Tax=Pseudonocardia sp. TRM90224 TaxID=2812678 RepID=UPI001E633D71